MFICDRNWTDVHTVIPQWTSCSVSECYKRKTDEVTTAAEWHHRPFPAGEARHELYKLGNCKW